MGEAEGKLFRCILDSPAAREELLGSSTGGPWPSSWCYSLPGGRILAGA
jgi:hypothetical protein